MSTLQGDSLVSPSGVERAETASAADASWQRFVPYVLFGTLVLLAVLPLVVLQFMELRYHPYYRFYPIVLVGAAVLAIPVFRSHSILRPGSLRLGRAFWLGSTLLLAGAGLLGSPWLGVIAALAAIATGLYGVGGMRLFREGLPAWGFLWLAVPPPLGIDDWIMSLLRNATAGGSSGMLDLLGIYHVVTGYMIEIQGRQLFVDEGCSGIHAFFALVPVTIFYVLWTRRPLSWGLPLVAASAGWALVANIARVVGVTVVTTQWERDITAGWEHELFGLGVYAVAIGLLISTDRLVCYLTVDLRTWGLEIPGAAAEPPAGPGPRLPPFAATSLAAWYLLPGFGGLALLNAAFLWTQLDQHRMGNLDIRFAELGSEALPETVGDWKRQEYATEHRNPEHPSGENSQIWRYRAGAHEAIVSLDYPYRGWHELSVCYQIQGWEIGDRTIQADRGLEFVQTRIHRPYDAEGFLLFAMFDAEGKSLRPQVPTVIDAGLVNRIRRRLADTWLLAPGGRSGELRSNTYQLQMCVMSDAEISQDMLREAHQFFRRIADAIPRPVASGERPAT